MLNCEHEYEESRRNTVIGKIKKKDFAHILKTLKIYKLLKIANFAIIVSF